MNLFLPAEAICLSIGFLTGTLELNNFPGWSFQEACWLWKALEKQCLWWIKPWPTGMVGGVCTWQPVTPGASLWPPSLASLSDLLPSLRSRPSNPGRRSWHPSWLPDVSTRPGCGPVFPPPSSLGINSCSEHSAASYQDQRHLRDGFRSSSQEGEKLLSGRKPSDPSKGTCTSSQRWASTCQKVLCLAGGRNDAH